MQRKALAALATALAALVLGACGGGEETGTTGTTAPSAGAASGDPGEVQRRADQIEEERRRQGADERDPQQPEPSARSGSGEDGDAPDQQSSSAGQDSGGGAAQFQRKGGDNSLQEFGEEVGGSEMERAAAALHAYLDARAERRWDDACSHLSAKAVAGIEQFAAAFAQDQEIEGCPDVLGALSQSTSDRALREAARADVGSLRAEGGRGFLLYHGARGVDYAIAVAEEGGEWKLAAPEATPLP